MGAPSQALCCLFSWRKFTGSEIQARVESRLSRGSFGWKVTLSLRLCLFLTLLSLLLLFFSRISLFWWAFTGLWCDIYCFTPVCSNLFSSACSNIPSSSMQWNPKEVAFLWFKDFFKFVLLPLLFPSKAYFFTEALGDHLSYFVVPPSPEILLS